VAYEIPGRTEPADERIAELWNQEIARAYKAEPELHSRFFALDPEVLRQPQVTEGVTWPADPLEPTFCTDDEVVQTLCDWGSRGRHALHNEYCEYAVLHRDDPSGRRRPKRIQVTTELREYWLMLATHDPVRLRAAAADVLGRKPSWDELYGVADPIKLSKRKRRQRFAFATAGNGREADLEEAGIPADPAGALNTENALFMSHPINGLDDLVFIVLFGARRFAVRDPAGAPRRAEKEDIFGEEKQRGLACRHADPTAALAAYGAVLGGRAVSFANPLGMYIRPFNQSVLEVSGAPIPAAWVRWSRGEEGMFQRLEVGPGDDDDAFLDEIELSVGQERQRLTGGYQLIRMLEVGPLLATGEAVAADEDEFEWLPAGSPIECSRTGICKKVDALEKERRLTVEQGADAGSSQGSPTPARTLQEGIFYAPGERPGKFFALMFLRAGAHCDARRAAENLTDLWRLFEGLKQGRVPDLDPVTVPFEEDNLQVLLGLGPSSFELPGVARRKPDGLEGDRLFTQPREDGGGPLLTGSGLAYAADASAGLLGEEFCVQVTADTKLAVDRTIVETWKLLSDRVDPEVGSPDLEPTTFYLGAQRSDRRSWIDFHDGLSNMRSEERERAIAIDARAGEEWCGGGTYLAFLRLAVDLAAWRKLSRREQELLVGRDKLSGCPIVAFAGEGELMTDPGCPVAGTRIWETPNDPVFAEPPRASDPTVAQSHVQRANHHGEGSGSGGRRIFRQGYEFLEWREGPPSFRAGLNFVSFQDTPERLTGMLTSEGWLGRVNFGGDPDRQPVGMENMLSVYAAGLFLVPPRRNGEPFPGASVLGL
jgi:hypothetical protein